MQKLLNLTKNCATLGQNMYITINTTEKLKQRGNTSDITLSHSTALEATISLPYIRIRPLKIDVISQNKL